MSPIGSISDLDNQAVQITDQRPDQNIFELDLTLWNLVATLCGNAPDVARVQFSLSEKVVRILATSPKEDLSKLASGVILSFQLRTPESDVFDFLSVEYQRAIPIGCSGLDGGEREFDVTYWLTLRNLARLDIQVAATAFGVSRDLSEALSKATDNHIRQLVSQICTACTLRFVPDTVTSLMQPIDKRARRQAFFKKHQQCLSAGGPV